MVQYESNIKANKSETINSLEHIVMLKCPIAKEQVNQCNKTDVNRICFTEHWNWWTPTRNHSLKSNTSGHASSKNSWYYHASFCRYVAGSPWLINLALWEKVTNVLLAHFFPEWVHFLFVQLTTAIPIVVETEVPFSKSFRVRFTANFQQFLESLTLDRSSGSLIVYSSGIPEGSMVGSSSSLDSDNRLQVENFLAISISASVVMLPFPTRHSDATIRWLTMSIFFIIISCWRRWESNSLMMPFWNTSSDFRHGLNLTGVEKLSVTGEGVGAEGVHKSSAGGSPMAMTSARGLPDFAVKINK